MSDRTRAWLAQRAAGVPPALVARMQRAVEDAVDDAAGNTAHDAVDDTAHDAVDDAADDTVEDAVDHPTVQAVLADAARGCLRDALAIGDDRAAALHLLAADALITHACEAATDEGGAALDRLASANSPERLAHLIDGNAES